VVMFFKVDTPVATKISEADYPRQDDPCGELPQDEEVRP
jgi:hypothetical protein